MELLNTRRLKLVRTGFVSHRATVDRPIMHSHETEYEIHFITDGTCQFFNGDDHFGLAAPALTFTPAGMPHAIRRTGTPDRFTFFYLCF